jgi:hypothetical protein
VSENVHAVIEGLDAPLASKVKGIIEEQWGKRVVDVKDIYLSRLYMRMEIEGSISYQPTNRYILDVLFRAARDYRQERFNLSA